MNEKIRTPNLIDEYPLLVYPSLAESMGINKAVVFQQLHFLLNAQKTSKNAYVFVDGKWWVYNTYEEWKETYFNWLGTRTLKGIFLELQKDGLVLFKQSVKNKSDRRKWYTIDYEVWDKYKLTIGQKLPHQPLGKKCTMDGAENVHSNGQKVSDGYSETSSGTSTETKDSADAPNPTFPKSLKSYTAAHILAYQSLHKVDMVALVHAWAGNIYNSITEFSTKVGRMYIEVHQELVRLNKPYTEYATLAVYTKKKDAWKNNPVVTDMLLYVTEYKVEPKVYATEQERWADIPELAGIKEIIR